MNETATATTVEQATIEDALRIAVGLHQDHEYEPAETIYRRVLAVEPEQPDALHFLGVLLHERGKTEAGIPLIQAALERVPDHADAHSNLGNLYRAAGRYADAGAQFQKA